ncbi:MAG TPA: helicase HerA-like domain-containing protein [Candidatus Limnocylindrales bacterium]|nr:helicase HerA-like domain-containing protein [Candidatus Limnocylindrales bacterium]
MDEAFHDAMTEGYALAEPSVVLGSPMRAGDVANDVRVQVALSMLNRHGLVAGATGTGKTKTLQLMAGQLSKAGVPVFIADIKGDLTGLAAPGETGNPKLQQRLDQLAWTMEPSGHPVEFLSLSGKLGAQVRATVHSFGPLLLGKVLNLNDTQTSILSLVFKYCDDNQLPLLDLADLRTTLAFLGGDDGKAALASYGGISPASLGVIGRSIVTLEQEGADVFFGEPEFDVMDLMRVTPDGSGIISILELSDVMDKPRLFSTFMLWMLAQLYHALPEAGDLPKPKLGFFFDEAHLLFDDASEALLDQVEQTARLIRSKGVGVFFATQTPADIPASVLAQLGNRFEHALRAFTPQDADNLRKTVRTFPITAFYEVEQVIQQLGTGEALVTVLSPRGVPTPLAATLLVPPDSLMAALDAAAFQQRVASGLLQAKYGTPVDRQSAHEIITARLQQAQAAAQAALQAQAAQLGVPAPAGGGAASGPSGAPGMTPAQMQREIARQAKDQAKELARQQREAEAERKRRAREAAADARQRNRMIETGVRTAGRVASSRAGQDLIRGVFGVLFGGKR